jgi:hypothetical protein
MHEFYTYSIIRRGNENINIRKFKMSGTVMPSSGNADQVTSPSGVDGLDETDVEMLQVPSWWINYVGSFADRIEFELGQLRFDVKQERVKDKDGYKLETVINPTEDLRTRTPYVDQYVVIERRWVKAEGEIRNGRLHRNGWTDRLQEVVDIRFSGGYLGHDQDSGREFIMSGSRGTMEFRGESYDYHGQPDDRNLKAIREVVALFEETVTTFSVWQRPPRSWEPQG